MSARVRVGAALVLAGAAGTWAPSARADGAPSRVAVVRSSPNDRVLREAATRVRAELAAAGFEVVEVDRAPGDPRSQVEQSPDPDSFATIAMSRAPDGAFAEVWISDRITGKIVARRLAVGAGPDATTVVAVRALELLRASLLEIAANAPPAEPPKPAPEDVMRWVAPALPATPSRSEVAVFQGGALGVGVLALHGLSGVGLALGPTVSFSHGVGPLFARLTWAGPLAGPELTTSHGTATIRQALGALAVGWASDPKPLGGYAWVGAGAFDLHASGSASAPYRGVDSDVASFLFAAGIGGSARLGSRVALVVEATMVILDPQPVVVIAGSDAGSAGAPSVGASLGVVVGL